MSDEFRGQFLVALKNWVESRWDFDQDTGIKEVTSWDEHPGWGGGCDTCGYGADNDRIEISYKPAKGEGYRTYTYEGTFGEVLDEILRAN